MRIIELNKILDTIDYNNLWDGLKKTKFALYNKEIFFINDAEGLNMDLVNKNYFFVGKTDKDL